MSAPTSTISWTMRRAATWRARKAPRVEDGRLYLSKIFEWYGSDFVKQYAASGDTEGATERGVRGFVERYGAPDAAAAAKAGAKIRFLDYDWSLNDVQ